MTDEKADKLKVQGCCVTEKNICPLQLRRLFVWSALIIGNHGE